MKFLSFVLRLIAAVILLQTLFFKFTGAPESVYIFSTLGLEPWGRWASGIAELAASAALMYSPTRSFGALAAIGIMFGAILSHLLFLGIVVQDDGGLLFGLACTVTTTCLISLWIDRADFARRIRALCAVFNERGRHQQK